MELVDKDVCTLTFLPIKCWAATVKNRALKGSKCPYCEHRSVLEGYNDLQTLFPEIAKTWSPKNKQSPSEVSSRSNAEVLWICEKEHEWKARVADRTEGHGCPYCAGHKVWKGFNDLATTHPDLISEWSDKNKGVSPETITYKNRSNVWWHCSKCGNEYQAVVNARAKGRICPFCIAQKIKELREQRLVNKKLAKCDLSHISTEPSCEIHRKHQKVIFHYQETTESEGPVFLPPVTFASYRKIVDTHIVDADSLYLILDAVSLLIHPKQFSSELRQNNSKGATPNNSHILNLPFSN